MLELSFVILGYGTTEGIKGKMDMTEKKYLLLILPKEKEKSLSSLPYNGDKRYMHAKKTQIL